PALEAKGVALILSGDDNIIEIHLSDGHFATRSGFRVGQTYGELRRIYGDDVKVRNKDGNGGPFQAATIIAGGRELVFFKDWDEKDYSASTRITSILLMPPSSGIYGEC
ncbi:MAG: hypothetical protein Q4F67_07745, partial [Propionibacteriaceae bacterium]|nr:hypothetical protein [Propionibacteriaceae bacterium]